jgi:hypothetical protein
MMAVAVVGGEAMVVVVEGAVVGSETRQALTNMTRVT